MGRLLLFAAAILAAYVLLARPGGLRVGGGGGMSTYASAPHAVAGGVKAAADGIMR